MFISVIRIFIQLLTIALTYEKFHDIGLFLVHFKDPGPTAGESGVLRVITLIPESFYTSPFGAVVIVPVSAKAAGFCSLLRTIMVAR